MASKLKTKRVEAIKPNDFARIKIDKTQQIIFATDSNIEQELSQLSRKDLEYRLNFEETDPQVIKLITKFLKTKK